MPYNGGVSRKFLQATGAGATVVAAGCIGDGDDGTDSIRYLSRGGSTHDAEREIMEQWSEESGVQVEHQEAAEDTEMFNYPTPIEDPPEEITSLPDWVDSPDDLAWIDFFELLPRFEELEQRLAEIKAS